ncbi:MAG: hypothetical protein KKA62_05035 [Nanoarchaeota archaeon]|nr:hypothetical protein [Nanoarchaeota archaeon]MBU1644044.1 hypothetical protein [Nanoarchaeota archaeon]MBU1977286.1 hypothetical protein [Nanoarchaeota archaeon]
MKLEININKKHFLIVFSLFVILIGSVFYVVAIDFSFLNKGKDSSSSFGHSALDISGLPAVSESISSGAERYYLEVDSNSPGGGKIIPIKTIIDLCGDEDGCEYRLGMKSWTTLDMGRTAMQQGIFAYDEDTKKWRAQIGIAEIEYGQNSDGITKHVKNLDNKCYFTDGEYKDNSDLSDNSDDFFLLRYTASDTFAGRICMITLID